MTRTYFLRPDLLSESTRCSPKYNRAIMLLARGYHRYHRQSPAPSGGALCPRLALCYDLGQGWALDTGYWLEIVDCIPAEGVEEACIGHECDIVTCMCQMVT